MSHPESKSFVVEIPVNDPEKMEAFQEAMNAYQDELVKYISDLAKKLGVSEMTAQNIWYLRGRSRWRQETEDRLICADQAGVVINTLSGEEQEELEKAGFQSGLQDLQ